MLRNVDKRLGVLFGRMGIHQLFAPEFSHPLVFPSVLKNIAQMESQVFPLEFRANKPHRVLGKRGIPSNLRYDGGQRIRPASKLTSRRFAHRWKPKINREVRRRESAVKFSFRHEPSYLDAGFKAEATDLILNA